MKKVQVEESVWAQEIQAPEKEHLGKRALVYRTYLEQKIQKNGAAI